jgi:hypothetical protein
LLKVLFAVILGFTVEEIMELGTFQAGQAKSTDRYLNESPEAMERRKKTKR